MQPHVIRSIVISAPHSPISDYMEYLFILIFFTRHMQGGSLPPQAPAPPVGYVSSTMVSDLETDLPDDEEEEEEDEEEDEGYGARHPRGIEHTPGSSMDNLDSSLTGKAVGFVSGAGGALT